ncbi:MAG: hypothetical protein K8I27_12840 [Planctomycetes bacterium]|nr:hypothetical protein [Planctomycetota bacterium]
MTEYYRWAQPESDSATGKFMTRLYSAEQRKLIERKARRLLKSSFVTGSPSVSIWKLPGLLAHRRQRIDDWLLTRELKRWLIRGDTSEGRRLARASAESRREEAEEFLTEAKMAEVVDQWEVALLDLLSAPSKSSGSLYRFLIRKCTEATGYVQESKAALVTAFMAYGKKKNSKVTDETRVRLPRIGLHLISRYLVESGQINGEELLVANMIVALSNPLEAVTSQAQDILVQIGEPSVEPLCAAL